MCGALQGVYFEVDGCSFGCVVLGPIDITVLWHSHVLSSKKCKLSHLQIVGNINSDSLDFIWLSSQHRKDLNDLEAKPLHFPFKVMLWAPDSARLLGQPITGGKQDQSLGAKWSIGQPRFSLVHSRD